MQKERFIRSLFQDMFRILLDLKPQHMLRAHVGLKGVWERGGVVRCNE